MRKLLFATICALAACTSPSINTSGPVPVPDLGTPVDAGKPFVISAPASILVNEGQEVVIPVTLSGGNGRSTVTYKTVDGSANAGADYIAVAGKLTGTGVKPVAVHALPDTALEGTEGFTVNFVASNGARATTIVNIVDTTVPPPPVMQTCPDGSVIQASVACPVLPDVATLPMGARVKAISACQSLTNPADAVAVGSFYTLVAFAGLQPIGSADFANVAARDVVVLNDASHLGDGWFGFYVPVGCVQAAP